MSSQKTLLLDLDGVIVDMVIPTMQWWGVIINSEDEYPQGFGYDMKSATAYLLHKQGDVASSQQVADMSVDSFWRRPTRNFWRMLQPYPTALSFIKYLERGPYDIYILTAHASAECGAAKLDWIDEYLPEYRDRVLLGRPKHVTATPNSILIDDYEENCKTFAVAGGTAILCPKPWNIGWNAEECFDLTGVRRSPYSVILDDLRKLSEVPCV
jgi:5'(3')-deoxyribonucleotidase